MYDMSGSWIWLLAFFPLWALMSGVWFCLVAVPKRTASASMCSFLDGSATILSIGSAAAILIGLNCHSIIRLPFADPACQASSFHVSFSIPEALIPFR